MVKKIKDRDTYVLTPGTIDRAVKDGIPLGEAVGNAYDFPSKTPKDINSLPGTSIITPIRGKYRGVQFVVVGFDATENHSDPEKPVKYQVTGKVGNKWIQFYIPSSEIKYLGKMPLKVWVRWNKLIPNRPVTKEELINNPEWETTDRMEIVDKLPKWF